MHRQYKFVDTPYKATPGDLPGEALYINGACIEHSIQGYRTLYTSGRESMSAEIDLLENGKADGSTYNGKRYPERVITVGFQLLANTAEGFRKKFNELGALLNVEQAQIIFEDEPDKFFIGTPGEIGEIEPGRNKIVGEFQIVCADPFKYSVEEHTLTVPDFTLKTFVYNGTVPTVPEVTASFSDSANTMTGAGTFEYYVLNDTALTFKGGDTTGTQVAYISVPSGSYSIADTYHLYRDEEDFDTATKNAMCQGHIAYTNTDATKCYKIRAALNLSNASTLEPSIEIYRDYAENVPQTEVRFMTGETVVYKKVIDDLGGVDFPFRISFERPFIDTISARRGYYSFVITYQFDTLIYTHKVTVDFVAEDSDNYEVSGAEMEYYYYFHGTGILTPRSMAMGVVDVPVYDLSNIFLHYSTHMVDAENARFYIDGVYTPYVNVPANDWDGFKIVPGENKARVHCVSSSEDYFSAVYKWREVFI